MLIKEISVSHEIQEFQNKELIFRKLLSFIESSSQKNAQYQYQSAYSLKALLWLKAESIFGLEDCFKFTLDVMQTYMKSELEGKDSSVELYLLNNWIKELSIRDLNDRISKVCN